uniref:2-phosphoxylose phosphatase 1 n=1 Tax=Ailuropoda melanoleuca TaxID=9646 RepID=A0A7N5P903_AILME
MTAHVMTCFASLVVHLTPVSTAKNGASSKSRKRVMPEPVTEPPVTDPIYEALLYCNIPSVAERSMEGHAPHHFKLVSVHVFIRHGDRYPLYVIPKTKRPEIDCTLVANRKPYHPKLEAFVSHMSKGSGASFESPLHSLPLYPNHPLCEMGELTQTGALYQRPQAATPNEHGHLSFLGGLSGCSGPHPTGVHPNIPTRVIFARGGRMPSPEPVLGEKKDC